MIAATMKIISMAYFLCFCNVFGLSSPNSVRKRITTGISKTRPKPNNILPTKETYERRVIMGVNDSVLNPSRNFMVTGIITA